ncbi:extracellular solute-binding protein [Paenibacillus apiarius]|uniref:extracellular solute-binding protein n=1 Tax=Paenibacillus apiarius TaxID=46240 RepID=UPI001980EF7B|nr:extracellular solute-binding protein [Paenibacillus apiarius]MBN3524803.1 extracellular solute-binding protein [Paenibacillus apiarius]
MKKWLKTTLLLTLAGSMLLTACGNNNAGDSGGVTNIKTQVINYAPEFIGPDNPLWQEFEKRTNTKLNITWLSPTTAEDKINVMLASGDLPDLTYVETLDNSQLRKMIDQGVFWDLTELLKEYPNLNRKEFEVMWRDSKINGKNYGVPRYYPAYGGGIFPMFRKDWLDKLQLQAPANVDEFREVLKAFKTKDPNGNGQADEVPYAATPGSMGFLYNVFNETQGNWKLKDGKLAPIITEDASRDALLYIKQLFDDGLLPPDFAIMKFSQVTDLIRSGKAGGVGYSMNQAWIHTEFIRKTDPNADLIPLASIENKAGVKYTPSGVPYYGVFLIPKKVPEDKMKKILSFLDYGYGPEGNTLAFYGVKDVHYKEENGNKVPTEQAKKDMVGDGNMASIFHLVSDDMAISAIGMPDDFYKRNVDIVTERKKVDVPQPDRGLFSEKFNRYFPDIQKKVDDMRTKVIIGKETIEAYDKLIEQLRNDAQLKEITDEMNEYYAKRQAEL